jgi:hypothetical protein
MALAKSAPARDLGESLLKGLDQMALGVGGVLKLFRKPPILTMRTK